MSGEKRILIVEDDADISMVEEAYLEAAGFQTVIVTNGAAVSGLLEEELFDLILLDLMLPGKSGYEVCREIRDKVDIPILMVTARTESVDKIRGLGLGADDYIAKPFDPAELVARVNANLRQYDRVMQKLPEEKISNWRRYGLMTCVFLLIAGKFIKGTKSYMVAWLTASR